MDTITIRDLALRCIIGIFPEERRARQDVILSIQLQCDLRPAGRSDAIEDTVNYKAIKKKLVAMVEKSRFYLIEALAERVASICLEEVRVNQVTVTVDKPGALRFARSVAVEITRERDDPAHPAYEQQ